MGKKVPNKRFRSFKVLRIIGFFSIGRHQNIRSKSRARQKRAKTLLRGAATKALMAEAK